MIEPFEPGQVREADGHKIVSYGTSSYGYDIRCSREFKIFTNINSTIVDPKAFDAGSFVDFEGDVCIIPPNSFALARTVEYFRIPRNVLVLTLGKSTYARCFRGDTRVALVDGTSQRWRTWRAVRIPASCSGATALARTVASSCRCSMRHAMWPRFASGDRARQRRSYSCDARSRLHAARWTVSCRPPRCGLDNR
jgi:hypothetical protein